MGLVRRDNNPADALSKLRHSGVLDKLLTNGLDNAPVEEWILRTEVEEINLESEQGRLANSNVGDLGNC